MRYDNARFRHQLGDQRGQRVDRLDAVVDEINLAIALQFGINRLADQLFLERRNHGLNRQAIARRRFDDRHIAQTHK